MASLSYGKKNSGFTVIEVLIVLAIVGLILLIIFLAIPAGMRAYRNHNRKRYAAYIASQLDEYKGIKYHFVYDGVGGLPDERCAFVNLLLQSGVTCSLNTAKNCRYAVLDRYDICFHPRNTPHSYIPPVDEMSFTFGHVCNTPFHNDGTSNPIMGDDTNLNEYAVWIKLESGPVFCIDNGS